MTQEQQGSMITIDDFDTLYPLGRGTFGKVMLVRGKRSDKLYAMKTIKKELICRKNLFKKYHSFFFNKH
jgi:serum/glucocorticoid-regulated kinase 2